MKKILCFKVIAVLCFVIALFSISGCDESKTPPTVCNFENPLTDLPWLKEKTDEFNLLAQEKQNLSITIYKCIYGNNETGFLIDEGNTKPFYNCCGEILCTMGGFAGETCSELNVVSQELIWEKNYSVSVWECVLEHFNTTITLTIDDYTNLVSVSKYPKEVGYNDQFHQFRDRSQYILQNDTLYLKNLDGTVCFRPDCSFAITKLSENEMKLEYYAMLPDHILYVRNYLFNRKK